MFWKKLKKKNSDNCKCCGLELPEIPTCFSAEAPWRNYVNEKEFAARVELNKDLCVIDNSIFLIRGHIEIPINDTSDTLEWSVWCSLSQESFHHSQDRWNSPERVNDGYFGWLVTKLNPYPIEENIKTNILMRKPGRVPLIQIQEINHPLFHEQENGITVERWHGIVREIKSAY